MEVKSISVIIPTLNSEKLLPACLKSILMQDYPADRIEIIIADGGSIDKTREIAEMYKCKIYANPLKTGEAGKAVGVKHASGELIALIDSDNILPDSTWFKKMVEPFDDPDIVGAEPLYYISRPYDSYITRYCALIGANDPLCIFLGNYDRYCVLTKKWTEMPVCEIDCGNYLEVMLQDGCLPTIGANGFFIRRDLLTNCSIDKYLFDIDIIYELVKQGSNKFAKVKIGIIHIFSGSIYTFIKKQKRRIKDYGYYNKIGARKYPWSSLPKAKLLKFIVYNITLIPLLYQMIFGWSQKKDLAWSFHLPACWITLIVYAWGTANNAIRVQEEDRSQWSQ